MDEKRSEFLTTMVGILGRLRDTANKHEEPLLAGMLELARTEAEDSLRHLDELATLEAMRANRSSTHSWRACDRPPEMEMEPDEVGSLVAGAEQKAA